MPAGTITALRAQVNDPQRVNLFVDGEFALGVSLNTISKEQLHVGKALSAEDYDRIAAAESADKAFTAALRLLEARPRSTAEIRDRLRRKTFAPEAIDHAVARLSALDLIDDAAFARYWVENRQANRPRGVGALRDELRRKGIDRAVADTVLNDDALTGAEDDQAMALARGALHKYADAADRTTFARRLGGFLQRRGYTFETIRPILEQLWRELQDQRQNDEERP